MFPSLKRLPRSLFPSLAKTGRRISSAHFGILATKDDSIRGYAVIVPKKIARLSVTRHRVKRQISAILRTLHLPPACVVSLRQPVVGVQYQDMKEELGDLFSKINNYS